MTPDLPAIRVADAVTALEELPDGSVDMVLTDIAYESLERHRSKGTTTRLKQSKSSSNPWFGVFPNVRILPFLMQCYRVLDKERHGYFWCDDETGQLMWDLCQFVGFYPWKFITWVKVVQGPRAKVELKRLRSPMGLVDAWVEDSPWKVAADQVRFGTGYHYPGAVEKILFVEKRSRPYKAPPPPLPRLDPPGDGRQLLGGSPSRSMGHAGDVFFAPRPKGRDGRKAWPTEKPVDIQQILVEQSTSRGEAVADPFCGSGSSGEAIVKAGGRRMLLSDLSPEAVELTTRRVELARKS